MGWHAKPPGTIEFTFGPPGEVKKRRAFARLVSALAMPGLEIEIEAYAICAD
jgi:hypothetical protein